MTALSDTSLWFPDLVARWYDDFSASFPHGKVDLWHKSGPKIFSDWQADFLTDPHNAAGRLNSWIVSGTEGTEPWRRYRALEASSDAIADVGFEVEARNDAKSWRSLQRHWRTTGNLLRKAEGLLLPVEKRVYPWVWRSNPLSHTLQSHRADFPSFVRWKPAAHPELAGLKIRVNVLSREMVPTESLKRQLKVAVVPLIPTTDQFEWSRTELLGVPSFRVALKNQESIANAALSALSSAANVRCDILVFPELCLTTAMQKAIGDWLYANSKGYPWLVVAGSAPTPTRDGSGDLHNRAIVFNGVGWPLMQYHKLHRYEMSRREQDRYGLADVFGEIARIEDIAVDPLEIGVLDTQVGRMAVVICEDLSAVELLEPLVSGLGLDWLLAPVLDGSQTHERWTARFGRRYAERGSALVVATSLGLVSKHCQSEAAKGNPIPAGVGLVVRPTLFGAQLKILTSADHAQPAVTDLVED
jgi:predicted amidohydrolase